MNRIDKSKKAEGGKKYAIDKRNRSLRNFSVIMTVLFVVIVLVFNIVFDQFLGSKLKWDWTSSNMYSIGDVSKEIISKLDKNVEIIGLFSEDSEFYSYYQNIIPLLEEYESRSNGRISLKFIDPDIDPTLLRRVDPDNVLKPAAGSFLIYSEETGKAKNLSNREMYRIEMNEYYESVVTGVSAEQNVTGAIRYVQSETTPVVYFTSGHDELDYSTQYATMLDLIRNNNYDVASLDLFGLDQIPDDCAVMIMADPKKDITPGERLVLSAWLKEGGSLMIMSSFNQTSFPELNILLSDYNLEISSDKLREEEIENQFQQDPYSIRANAPAGKITATKIDRYTLSLNSRAVNQLMNVKDWIVVEPILTTSDQGVAEAGGIAENASAQAKLNIAMLSENSGWVDGKNVKDPAKVIVYGSSEIFREDVIQAFGTNLYNPTLFYNSINWLAGTSEEDSLLIEPKVPTSYAITKGTTSTLVATTVVVMILVPLALLLTALFVYRKRKNL